MKSKEIFELSPLFEDVQINKIFADGKTFVDCIPKEDTQWILNEYLRAKNVGNFNLKEFVLQHFELPQAFGGNIVQHSSSVEEHINHLWAVLTRKPDEAGGSLIPLPHSYVVPGGRFGEVYYWDSYFTMLGLHASGLYELIESMVKNFSHLINTVGFIPNGNRTYYLGRSQPPFFSLMVQLLATIKGKSILIEYLPALEKEYAFWMNGTEQLNKRNIAVNHVVKMRNGSVLNRYWDAFDTPRPESYREDVELAHHHPQPEILYRHLRAGAASGWDYSCRWFKHANQFETIHTTEIIPVDLNCLLYNLEQTIAEAHHTNNHSATANEHELKAEQRKQTIHQYCWNEQLQFFTDYDFMIDEQKQIKSLAAASALFLGIATQKQADAVATTLEKEFLKDGGLICTPHTTGQQWDAPNGWAPLQWMSIVGLEKYNHNSLAATIAQRWIKLNKDVFARTGKLMEKYNVVDTHLEAGGGEYEGQDGFGWTNGVLLGLLRKY
jgi:alpha,alpha-trehalase